MKQVYILSYTLALSLQVTHAMTPLYSALEYGSADMQGRRPTLQDTHVSVDTLADGQTSLFALFDGHGGNFIADVEQNPQFPHDLPTVLHETFHAIDNNLMHNNLLEVQEQAYSSGTTAVVALINPFAQTLSIAHVGDSRALLSRNGYTVVLTHDHTPTRPEEKARIEAAGGFISRSTSQDIPRVNNRLAISRALGDHALRSAGVIALPEITQVTLTLQDEFLLLACDGIFESMSNQEALRFVRSYLTRHAADQNAAQQAAQALIQEAYNRGSTDNLSAIIILIIPQVLYQNRENIYPKKSCLCCCIH